MSGAAKTIHRSHTIDHLEKVSVMGFNNLSSHPYYGTICGFIKFTHRLFPALLLALIFCAPAFADPQAPAPVPTKATPGYSAPVINLPQASAMPMPAGGAAGGPVDEATRDIRDIRGPLPVPNPWFWPGVVGASLALAGFLYGLVRLIARRRREKALTAHEIAFARLQKARVFLEEQKPAEYSLAVSGAIRPYVENRFQVAATKRTTREFLGELAADESGPLAAHTRALDDFLVHCDLAKFARFHLNEEQMELMFRSAWDFVEATRPRPEDKKKGKKEETVSVDKKAGDNEPEQTQSPMVAAATKATPDQETGISASRSV